MAHRYAVLLDRSNGDGRPVGIAVEYDGRVIVDLPPEYGVPVEHTGEYRVLQPNFAEVVYRPGDVGYLDQVLVDLFWGFAIGEMGEVAELTPQSYRRLRVAVLSGGRRSGAYAAHRPAARVYEPAAAMIADDLLTACKNDLALVA
jgi:hypothetical protein